MRAVELVAHLVVGWLKVVVLLLRVWSCIRVEVLIWLHEGCTEGGGAAWATGGSASIYASLGRLFQPLRPRYNLIFLPNDTDHAQCIRKGHEKRSGRDLPGGHSPDSRHTACESC